MTRLPNIHPGEILLEEFLIPLEISAYKLAKDLAIPQTRISQILKGKRRISADTALRLSRYFGNSPKFWLGLQDDYDIEEEKKTKKEIFLNIRRSKKTQPNMRLYAMYCVTVFDGALPPRQPGKNRKWVIGPRPTNKQTNKRTNKQIKN